jgi:hypothetical protein
LNLVLHFSYKFCPFAPNLCDTEKTNEIAVIGLVRQLSLLLCSVVALDLFGSLAIAAEFKQL